MRPKVVTVALPTAVANSIATSQKPSVAGNLTLASTTLDKVRRVAITSDGNDSARKFTVTGTDRAGNSQSEIITGPNATSVNSLFDYATVTQIAVDAGTAGNITVGTSAVGSSQWVVLDHFERPQISIQCVVSGTINYTVEETLDNLLTGAGPYTIFNSSDTNVVAATTNKQSNFAYRPSGVRVTVNTSTAPGSVTLTVLETGPLSV